jgi:hypothetical protein
MNPANGNSGGGRITGAGPVYGNAFPMFGSGQALYGQLGYLLPALPGDHGAFMPYASAMYADWNRLNGKPMLVTNLGLNWLINGHKAKLSLDWQNRPVFGVDAEGKVLSQGNRNCVVLQYQIFL